MQTHAAPNFSRRLFAAFAVAFGVMAAGLLSAPAANAKVWFEGDVFGSSAVRGYDVVAYFTQGRPVEGTRTFTHSWMGTEWRFASAEHRDLFVANPEKYAPQYGGWCAWAVSQGYTASTDPEAWRIVDGKLYLNYSKSVQSDWNRDIPRHISDGDRNWPKIKAKLTAK
ncbi:MAG: YHS domain-containing (seleno)protein [Alphaproteobacteria bacterium]